MTDYIKREEALAALHKAIEYVEPYKLRERILKSIADIPTADLVEVFCELARRAHDQNGEEKR